MPAALVRWPVQIAPQLTVGASARSQAPQYVNAFGIRPVDIQQHQIRRGVKRSRPPLRVDSGDDLHAGPRPGHRCRRCRAEPPRFPAASTTVRLRSPLERLT